MALKNKEERWGKRMGEAGDCDFGEMKRFRKSKYEMKNYLLEVDNGGPAECGGKNTRV